MVNAPTPDRWPFPAWTVNKHGRHVPALKRIPAQPAPDYPTDEENLL